MNLTSTARENGFIPLTEECESESLVAAVLDAQNIFDMSDPKETSQVSMWIST